MSIKSYELDTLKGMIEHTADLYKNKPAFLIKDERGGDYKEISYADFRSDIIALGTKMISMGLKGERIAVVGANCYPWIVTYFATVCGVGTVVPLDKELSPGEMENLIKQADCRAVFYTDEFEKVFRGMDVDIKVAMKQFATEEYPAEATRLDELISDGDALISSGDDTFLNANVDPNIMSMLLYTSGTTGTAKGVMLSHNNIMSNVRDIADIAKIYPEDRTLSILPIHHTFESSIGIIAMLYHGGSIAFGEGLKYIAKNLVEAKATILVGVPLIFESVFDKIWREAKKSGRDKVLKAGIKINRTLMAMGIDKSRKIFSSIHSKFGGKLRMFVTGAAAIDPKVIRGFEDVGIVVLQGYGLTECSPLISGTPENGNRYQRAGSVGPVVNGGKLDIINKDNEGIGEIIFRGPNLMLGYHNMPEETEKVIVDGWFHTGDLGFMGSDGWLYITGRKKNVIVTKTGKNIYPEEIESYILKSEYIDEAIIYGATDKNDKTIVAVVIRPAYDVLEKKNLSDDDKIYEFIEQIVAELNQGLPNYKRIMNISVRRQEFLKTTTKKIKRNENIPSRL